MGSRFRLEREEEEGMPWCHSRRRPRHLDKWWQIIFPLSGERLWGWYCGRRRSFLLCSPNFRHFISMISWPKCADMALSEEMGFGRLTVSGHGDVTGSNQGGEGTYQVDHLLIYIVGLH